MKTSKLFTSLTLIATLLFLAACGNTGGVDNTEQVDLEVKEMTLDEVVNLASDQNFGVHQLVHEYKVNGEPTVGFLPINDSGDLENVEQRWAELYKGMLLDLADSEQRDGSEAASIALQTAAESQEIPEFKIIGVIGETQKNELPTLKSYPKVNSLHIKEEAELGSASPPYQREEEIGAAGVKRWAPTSGTVYVYPSKHGVNNRYVSNYMEWSRDEFRRGQGYEHDFFLNNYPESTLPGTYFDRSVRGTRRLPNIEYASTTWPSSSRPYLDTRLGDDLEEVAYTIGMVYANQISSRKRYRTYIRVKRGDAGRDNAKLTGFLMAPRPLTCGSQWCMFSRDRAELVDAWDIPVPGKTTWRY